MNKHSNIYRQRINRVIDYIEEHLDEKLTLEKLAALGYFSKYHFHRIFKTVLGETLNQFIKRLKMEKTCRLLILHKEKTITEIAIEAGYQSSANFSRDFVEFYQMSPSRIRSKGEVPVKRQVFLEPDIRLKFLGIEKVPDQFVLYQRIHTGYDSSAIREAFKKLLDYSQKHNLIHSIEQVIGIGYDDPDYTPKEKCRYDACISVERNAISGKENPFNTKSLKGGNYAVFLFKGRGEEFHAAWDKVFREWVGHSTYVPANRPHFERYLPHSPQKGIFNAKLCLPVKKLKQSLLEK